MARTLLAVLKRVLHMHLAAVLLLPVALYLFLGVPQIANVWKQGWLSPQNLPWIALYALFLIPLLGYHIVSLVLVVRDAVALAPPPVRSWPGRVGRFLLRLPDTLAHWLVWASSRPPARVGPGSQRTLRPHVAWAGLVCLLLGGGLVALGPRPENSTGYAVSGAAVRNAAGALLGVGVWLVGQALLRSWKETDKLSRVGLLQARVIGWAAVGWVAGELIWTLAALRWPYDLVSYRAYTVWANIHLLTLLIVVAQLLDRWHTDPEIVWPVRPAALLLALLGLALNGAHPIPAEEYTQHVGPPEAPVRAAAGSPDAMRALEERDAAWFDHLQERIEAIPPREGPVVLVACSGGGSRAAIFAALVLEVLARTPIDENRPILRGAETEDRPRTWGDNVVLISGVSGGTLAGAAYVHRLGPLFAPPGEQTATRTRFAELFEPVADLQATTKLQLLARLDEEGRDGLADYLSRKKADDALNTPEGDLRSRLQEVQGAWKDCHGDVVRMGDWLRQADQLLDALETQREGVATLLDKTPEGEARRPVLLQQREALEQVLARLWSWRFVCGLRCARGNETAWEEALSARPQLASYDWVLRSRGFDAMCMDFMAPIMRGALTWTLDRGDSLASFWTRELNWRNSTNLAGYGKREEAASFGPHQPLLLANVCDVARGSRLVVGFPALPHDLWERTSEATPASFERVQTFSRLFPDREISLARAVRMSSNFPWGLRVQSFGPTTDDRKEVHILDGGVGDNTGLDTIRALCQALTEHAKSGRAVGSPQSKYAGKAQGLLKLIQERTAVLLEVDAVAKPDERLAGFPLAYLIEPTTALTNAGYASAEQNKDLYIRETTSLLTQSSAHRETDASAAEPTPIPSTALHTRLQCNHYEPGAAPRQDVMTALALGPKDKAQVVYRFLLELGLWNFRRPVLARGLAENRSRQEDQRRVERKQMAAASTSELQKTQDAVRPEVDDIARSLKANRSYDAPKVKALDDVVGRQVDRAKRLVGQIAALPATQADTYSDPAQNLTRQMEDLQGTLKRLEGARPDERPKLADRLVAQGEGIEKALAQVGPLRKAASQAAERVRQPQRVLDAQQQLDYSARTTREAFEQIKKPIAEK